MSDVAGQIAYLLLGGNRDMARELYTREVAKLDPIKAEELRKAIEAIVRL